MSSTSVTKRYVNLLVMVGTRIITIKKDSKSLIETTVDKEFDYSVGSLETINQILWQTFGINGATYNDSFAEIKRGKTIDLVSSEIHPYTARIKTAITFSAEPKHEISIKQISEIAKDMMYDSINYSTNSMHVIRVLTDNWRKV